MLAELKHFTDELISTIQKNGYEHLGRIEAVRDKPIFFKLDGSISYLINIYPDYGIKAFTSVRDSLNIFVDSLINDHMFRHIIIYNIVVAETVTNEFTSLVDSSEEYTGQNPYDINYVVLPKENRIGYSGKQPQKFNNIMKMLKDCLEKNRETSVPDNPVVESTNTANTSFSADSKYPAASAANDTRSGGTELPSNSDGTIVSDVNSSLQKPIIPTDHVKLGKSKKSEKPVILVFVLMIINLVVLILMELNGGSENQQTLLDFGAMNITLFLEGGYYRAITAAFIHIGVMHFLYNSLSLYIFGSRVEKYLGSIRFFLVFLISAIIGNIINTLAASPDTILAGASGGIYGLLGCCLAITQLSKKMIQGLSFYSIFIFGVVGILLGFSDESIGNIAHLTGFVSGYLIGLIFTASHIRKRNTKTY